MDISTIVTIVLFVLALIIGLAIYAYKADKKHIEYRLDEIKNKINQNPLP